jgi:hypothetical protein
MRFSSLSSSVLLLTPAALLVSSVGAAGCCSQNHKDCISDCGGGASSCEGGACWGGNKFLLWLPGAGSENDPNCFKRWSGDCQTDAAGGSYDTADDSKCCGTLVCGRRASDNYWQCNHPLDICSTYGENNCPDPICTINQSGECVPSSEYYHNALPSASQGPQPGPAPQPTPVPAAGAPWEDTTPDSYCPEVNNLGEGYSAAIGFQGTFPKTHQTNLTAKGSDDAISFLVGGNYVAPAAAEIEGKAVVLGDFIIGTNGTNSIGKHHTYCIERRQLQLGNSPFCVHFRSCRTW